MLDIVELIMEKESQKPDDTAEARAMVKLMESPYWVIYETRLKREMALSIKKASRASGDEMRAVCQGAMLQMERVLRLPHALIETAEKKRRAAEPEEEDGERKLGRRIEPARVQP